MPKYRKKPVVIEARQFHRDNLAEILLWINHGLRPQMQALAWRHETPWDSLIQIKTLEGDHLANHGDFIIKGIAGEFYPCKPDIFEATYELVEE